MYDVIIMAGISVVSKEKPRIDDETSRNALRRLIRLGPWSLLTSYWIA